MNSEISYASDEDMRIARQNALREAGLSEEELRAEACSGQFSSLESRLAWMLFRDN